jgi:hypothetical protein
MDHRLIAGAIGAIFFVGAGSASAQPAATPTPTAPFAIPNPTYTTLVLETPVDRPAKAVWGRIGKYCDIGEWMRTTCAITSGADGQPGAVRRLGLGVTEMLVAKTDLSYTYAQPVRVGVPYNAYHGTLEVRPVTASTSKLVYSFFYDNSVLADDAARATESAGRRGRFTQALQNMKVLAEGGTLPAAPAPR